MPDSFGAALPRRAVIAALALLAGLLLPVGGAPAARADTAPVDPAQPVTVSADALPTVQVNGVVWDQVVVGNRVYATGSFSSARPAGSAAGSNETARANLLAYDLTTGALVTSWAPTLNAQGLTITASPDGSTVYVGGDFTSVSGVTRNRIVALNAGTGAVVTGFAASLNGRVRALQVSGSQVYAGGSFTTSSGQPRSRLASFSLATGALSTWAPVADAEVMALTLPAGLNKVVAGGRFKNLAGSPAFGLGAVDATTGSFLRFAAESTVRDAGPDAAIYSLTSAGGTVYGTGYTYLVNPGDENDGNFESVFSADASTGSLTWVSGCRGDTYDAAALGSVVYSVGHPHDCSAIGGNPQTDPWTYQRAQAMGAAPQGNTNVGGYFPGLPAPSLLHWLPTLDAGSYTGQGQGAWTVTGNSQYVVLGGEFPRVNSTAQQGLVRFAVSGLAPNAQGPQGQADLKPTLTPLAPGTVRVAFRAAWDRDNTRLTYEVLRGNTVASSSVLKTFSYDSNWWTRPGLAFADTTAAPGSSQTYRVRVKDPFGNTVTGGATTATVPAGQAQLGAYTQAVLGDGALHDWRLGETSGSTGYDWAGGEDLTLDASATRGTPGALANEPATGTTFTGTATVPATSSTRLTGPQAFSVETWFRTTSTSGGKLIGFGDSATGTSSNYDRQLYLTNDGRLAFGVYSDGVHTLTTGTAYNDGQWHHVVGTLGAGGQALYVDGALKGRDAGSTRAQPFAGYWRVGGDNLGGWPDQPSSNDLSGSLQEVAVYPSALSLDAVRAHYVAAGRTLNVPTRPADAYGAAVYDAGPSLYWRLDDAAAATGAFDTATAETDGAYSAGVQKQADPSPAASTGKAATFPGDAGAQTVTSTVPVSDPRTFSLELWFRTRTDRGGRLIGFGNGTGSAASTNYDRYVYMLDGGRLRYGIWTGTASTVDSPLAYNDGNWHHLVATQGPGGQQLYVDGALVGTGTATDPQPYAGYWRLGSDNTWGGATSNDFAGSIDEAAVYPAVLSATAVQQHWQLGAPAANQRPTAAFTSSATGLTAAFDAGGSSDPDGTIASYAWTFGDGGTGTGKAPSHAYAAAGTYPVTLTVTDDGGATGTTTRDVTVAATPNQDPAAAFTSTTTDLAASFDAGGSSDPDGTIASYAWTFGDGGTGTGKTPSHPYAAAGTYPVTLTVTDDHGATGSVSHPVTVTAPGPAPLATDGFERTVTGGWGTAPTGGGWTLTGGGTTNSVGGGTGQTTVTAGKSLTARLAGVSNRDNDVTATTWTTAMPTGGGAYLSVIARSTAAGDYRGRVKIASTGAVQVQAARMVGSTETTLGTAATVPGLTYTAGTRLRVRVQATGSAPTTIRVKVWVDGGAEPAGWTVTATDSTSGFGVAGAVGLYAYTSGSATASLPVRFDDLAAVPI